MATAWRVTTGTVIALTVLSALAAAGCSSSTEQTSDDAERQAAAGPVKLIGDGSTAYTGRQPHQPVPKKLPSGRPPPQFVVFSWDGAAEDSQQLFSHFREVGRKYDAKMTYFLSGVYLLPQRERERYKPPKHAPGSSDIGFNDEKGIKDTLEQVRGAWLEGNEIGTHFNGHFCGPDGGVGTWSTEEWKSEIEQAEKFVKSWKTTTGLEDAQPLPFDYSQELVGGRAPCLEGQKNLIPAAKEMGFRYDASSAGGRQVWPSKIDGIWDFPLPQIPMPGRAFETLAMDYNFLANQSGTVKGDPSQHAAWGEQMRDGMMQAFERAYTGNRAPLFIGNHFESWNGGTYMRAVEDTIKTICPREEVRCVTFKQLTNWLDAQDPKVLDQLRTLDVGERPAEGWDALLDGRPARPSPAPAPSEKPGDAANGDAANGDQPGRAVRAAAPVRRAAG